MEIISEMSQTVPVPAQSWYWVPSLGLGSVANMIVDKVLCFDHLDGLAWGWVNYSCSCPWPVFVHS